MEQQTLVNKPKGVMDEFLERNKSQSIYDIDEDEDEEFEDVGEEDNFEFKKPKQLGLNGEEEIKGYHQVEGGSDTKYWISTKPTENVIIEFNYGKKYKMAKECISDIHKYVISEGTEIKYGISYNSLKGGNGGGGSSLTKECYEQLKSISIKDTSKTDEELQKEIKNNIWLKETFDKGCCSIWKEDGEFYFHGDIGHCGSKAIFKNAKAMAKLWTSGVLQRNYNDAPKEYGCSIAQTRKEAFETYKHDIYLLTKEGEIVLIEDNFHQEENYNKMANNTQKCPKCEGTLKPQKDTVYWLECNNEECCEVVKNGNWGHTDREEYSLKVAED